MNPDLKSIGVWLLVCALAIGAAGGWVVGRMPLKTQLAQLNAAHDRERVLQAAAALTALTEAQTRGDLLSSGLLTQQAHIDQLKAEKRHAITQATTGSTCLSEPALRLLNTAPGLTVAGLPQTTGSAVAAGERIATDTDISFWVIDAGAAYQVCRARLDALIDWHTGQTTTLAAP